MSISLMPDSAFDDERTLTVETSVSQHDIAHVSTPFLALLSFHSLSTHWSDKSPSLDNLYLGTRCLM